MDTETHYSDVWVVISAFNRSHDRQSRHRCAVSHTTTSSAWTTALRQHQHYRPAVSAHLVRHPINLGQGRPFEPEIEYARKQPGAQVLPLTAAGTASKAVRNVDRLGAGDVDMERVRRPRGPSFGQPTATGEADRAADRAVEPWAADGLTDATMAWCSTRPWPTQTSP